MIRHLFLACLLLSITLKAFAADVQISQVTDSPDPVARGGNITYIVSLLNNDNDTANNVTLTVPLPATTSFVSVDNANCSHDGGSPGTLSCNLGNITGNGLGGPVSNISFVLATSAATSTTVSLTATVATTSADTNPTNDSESNSTTINDGADLSVTVSDSADPVTAGGNYSYTLNVGNLGPNTANSVTLVNTLPTNVSYVSASGTGWSCSHANQKVTCTRPSLANGVNAPAITLNAKVTGQVTGNITNSVTVSSQTSDPKLPNNTATENTVINQGTELTLGKTVAAPVIANATTSFTLTPRNEGPYDATNLAISDTLPAGFTFVSASGSGWSCSHATGTVSCTRASYSVGATDDITIVTSVPASGSNVVNSAALTSASPDPDLSNNTGSVTFSVVPDGSDLGITKSKTPNPVANGADMTSRIVVTNSGPSATTGTITVTDTLSANETYQSFSGTNWSCVSAGNTVTCTYGISLANNASSSELQIVTRATSDGNISNTACVAAPAGKPDTNAVNDCATASAVGTATIADLGITKTVSTPGGDNILTVGETTITYVLNVTNTGEDIVDPANGTVQNGVVIRDTIPGFVTGTTVNANVTSGSQQNFTCSVTGAVVECILNDGQTFAGSGDGGPADTVGITITTARALLDGSFTNTATVSSGILGETNRANNSADVAVVIQPVTDVELQSLVITPNNGKEGVDSTYVITFINNGPSTANNVVVAHDFTPPAGRTYEVTSSTPSAGSCGVVAGNKLTCNIGNLAANQTETITLKVRPGWDGANSTWVLGNSATISTSTTETNSGNNNKTQNLSIAAAELDLLVNITDIVDPVGWTPTPRAFPGSIDNIIIYKADVTNRGPSEATGVVLTNTLKPKSTKQVTFLCDGSSATSCTAGTSLCNNLGSSVTGPASIVNICNLPDLNTNATLTRYLFYRAVSAPDSVGDTHTTTVSINSNEDDTIASNDSESQTTSLRVLVDLAVTKSPAKPEVSIKEPFNWNITVTNNGPGDSADSRLTDNLPAGMVLTGTPSASQGSCTGNAGNSSVNCSLGTINNGANVTVTVPVVVNTRPVGGNISNTATASTFGVDSNHANDSGTGTVAVRTSSIAGQVYNDLNDNGSIDGSEHGIAGVQLNLTGTDSFGNAVSLTANTDANGNYLFDNLAAGTNYSISEIQPANFRDGLDSAAGSVIANSRNSDVISGINLASNTALTNYNFAELGQASIEGVVWQDSNNNGNRESSETDLIENVRITLTGTELTSGKAINVFAITNSNGQYKFSNLTAGTYTLTETQPIAWGDGNEQLGSAGGTAGNDVFNSIVLNASRVATNYNFGERGSSLSGFVYRDLNNNGIKNSSESGIASVLINLSGTDADGFAVSRSTSSDATGAYQFVGLPASNASGYTLRETQPALIFDGKDSVGSLGGSLSNDVFSAINLPVNSAGVNYNFGEGRDIKSSISGRVYIDANNNGVFDSGEIGIAQVQLKLTGKTSTGAEINSFATTDVDGFYIFSDLNESDNSGYTVTQTQPSGFKDGLDSIGSRIIVNSNSSDILSGIGLGTNDNVSSVNFGELYLGGISGIVFVDNNNNGAIETDEQGIGQVTLQLFGRSELGRIIRRQTQTNSTGYYLFDNLPASNADGYTITEAQPKDYKDGLDSINGAVISNSNSTDELSNLQFSNGQTLVNNNFAELHSASISGQVFVDADDDGLVDEGEKGIAKVALVLSGKDSQGKDVQRVVETDVNGHYLFNHVPISDDKGYAITQTQPKQFTDGFDSRGLEVIAGSDRTDKIDSLVLKANQTITLINFGERYQGRLTGTVFIDVNNNGLIDDNEKGLVGVTLTLTGLTSSGVKVSRTTITKADGTYEFDNLDNSDLSGYRVEETHPQGYADGLDSINTQVLANSDTTDHLSGLVLANGETLSKINFANRYNGRIQGLVYVDNNQDSLYDDTETGIAKVNVQLVGTDIEGRSVDMTAETDEQGQFNFQYVPPSNEQGYRIIETQPEQYADGFESINAQIIANSDQSDEFSAVALGLNEQKASYNFGEINTSTLSGYVWIDSNGNGQLDSDEPLRVAGVTINLSGVEVESGKSIQQTTVTDDNGQYRFTKLRAGSYEVTEQQPAAWLDGKDQLGSLGGSLGNDTFTAIEIKKGQDGSDYNFGEVGSRLGGRVYNDMNEDGQYTLNEPGIPDSQLVLSGNDISGNPVLRQTVTDLDGQYNFNDLPLPNSTGYAVTETQPAETLDGQESIGSHGGIAEVNDVISQIAFAQHPSTLSDYNFGEMLLNPASISGMVWLDKNHNRAEDDGSGQAGWKVELIKSRADAKNNDELTPIATTVTDSQGKYKFRGLSAGVYEVRFLHPQGDVIYGYPISDQQGVDLSAGTINKLTLEAGQNVEHQSLPIDPSGVVYNSETREPVVGAKVTITGPSGFEPSRDLVGGIANTTQTTGEDGAYQFLLFRSAPAGVYQLQVREPTGYLPGVSKRIPACNNTLLVASSPNPTLVHVSDAPPSIDSEIHNAQSCPVSTEQIKASANTTQYYLKFDIDPLLPSVNVVNNHLPLDPYTDDLFAVNKTTPTQNTNTGGLVPYTISVNNNADILLTDITVIDQLPPGFKYVSGSAKLNGVSLEPIVTGRQLSWVNLDFPAQQQQQFTLMTIVGAGATEGKYVNQAWLAANEHKVSNVATATVQIVPDPIFDCANLVGKVFNDKNANGYQDKGETGIAAVRLATAQGLLVTTDEHGRYHIACADIPNRLRGSNFVVKVDERSLPSGFRVTTENPRVLRLTRGQSSKANFGATIHTVVRIQLNQDAFNGETIKQAYEQELVNAIELLKRKPSILRLAYSSVDDEDEETIEARLQQLTQSIKQQWRDCDCEHELNIEQEVTKSTSTQTVSKQKENSGNE